MKTRNLVTTVTEKAKLVAPVAIVAGSLVAGVTGCDPNSNALYSAPNDPDCKWVWDETNYAYQNQKGCTDHPVGSWYYGGHYYRSLSLLEEDTGYKSYKSSAISRASMSESDSAHGFGDGGE